MKEFHDKEPLCMYMYIYIYREREGDIQIQIDRQIDRQIDIYLYKMKEISEWEGLKKKQTNWLCTTLHTI